MEKSGFYLFIYIRKERKIMKKCSVCGEWKEYTEFYKRGKKLRNQCKQCVKARTIKNTEENKDRKKEYNQEYYSENKGVINMVRRRKYRNRTMNSQLSEEYKAELLRVSTNIKRHVQPTDEEINIIIEQKIGAFYEEFYQHIEKLLESDMDWRNCGVVWELTYDESDLIYSNWGVKRI